MFDYESCLKTAKQAACQFHRRNWFLEKDEVEAEAQLAMMEALVTWEPTKGRTLRSWIAFIVHRTLRKRFGWDGVAFDPVEIETISNEHGITMSKNNPEYLLMIKEKHEERRKQLSATAKEMLNMLNSNIEIPYKKNEAKRIIRENMREKGVAWNKIRTAFQELREATAQI